MSIKSTVKNKFLNMGESTYSANNRHVTGDTRTTKEYRQEQWEDMAKPARRIMQKVESIKLKSRAYPFGKITKV